MSFEKVTTEPTAQPVTLEAVKDHLRITHTSDDNRLASYIGAATTASQDHTNRAWVTQSRTQYRDTFPVGAIDLQALPVQSVTAIQYVDTNGTTQTLAASQYQVDTVLGRITEAYQVSWPAIREVPHGITIEYVCGYGDIDDVPDAAALAIITMVEAYYDEGMEAGLPMLAKTLLDQLKVWWL